MDDLDYSEAVGGAAPVNPCPRSARGGAVFFMVLLASLGWRVAGAWLAAVVSPFVDKICLYVDFICIFADIFVTLYYI